MVSDEAIVEIAKLLGQSVQHIYEIMVKAQPVVAAINLLTLVFIFLAELAIAHLILKFAKDADKDEKLFFLVIGMGLSLIALIAIKAILTSILTKLIVPEYAAIAELLKAIGR